MSNRIVRALEDGAKKIGKSMAEDGAKAVKDFYHSTGDNLKHVAKNTAEADAKHTDELDGILKGGKGDHLPHEPRTGGGAGRGPGDEEPSLGGHSSPGQRSDGNSGCTTGGDPVDVVSGQMISSVTDLTLPGLLPLVVSRSYASGYSSGRHLGPGWASTLDQRIEIDDRSIHFAGDDAQILHYPLPTEPGRSVFPTDGARWPLTWDPDDDTVRIEDPQRGLVLHFEPVAPGFAAAVRPLSVVSDRNGHRIRYHYNEYGLPVEVSHSGGYRVAVDLVHTAGGARVEALRVLDGSRDGRGTTVVSYGYDARGRLSDIVNSSGRPLVYGYDAQDRITSWTDRNGYWYAYDYGPDGRVVRGYGADGVLDTSFEYDTRNLVTTVTDSLGHVSTYQFDQFHHIVRVTNPLGGTVQTDYDRYGRLSLATDELGRTTRYTRDTRGEIVRVDHPDETCTSARYNELHLPTEVQSPGGMAWRQGYDQRGNRISLTDPDGATTQFAYDETGLLSSVTDALGQVTRVRDNPAGLAIEIVDAMGGRTRLVRDAFGRPVAVTDALGNTTRYTWSTEGRLLSQVTADGATERWTYDSEGNALTHVDPNGAVTAMEYAHFDQLATRTGPDGSRYVFTHDTELRLTQVTGPQGLTWVYAHDAAGRTVAETDFNGCTVRYGLDAAGQMLSRENGAGQVIECRYDAMGAVASKSNDGRTSDFSYDADGRLVRASSPDVELTRCHDSSGRLLSETINGLRLELSYDILGRRAERRTPSGATTAWTHDAAGGICSLSASGHTIAFERDALGRETARKLGSNIVVASAWDGVHRLTSRTISGDGEENLLQHLQFDYRADGFVTAVSDRHTGHRRFTSDRAGRVTAVHAEDWTESYAYDDIGNLVDARWPGRIDEDTRGERSYGGTLIRTAGRTVYENDRAGRVVFRRRSTLSGKADIWHYTWDGEDRLIAITTPDGTRWQYLYDPFGRRVGKQHLVDDGTGAAVTERTDFTWDGPTLVEQTAYSPDLPGAYSLTWDHQGYHPIAQTEQLLTSGTSHEEVDRRFFAIVTDLVGTPTRLLDAGGGTAWQARSTLWGSTTQHRDSTTSTPLRFPGQYYDAESRLHYNHHRYYDPASARYLSTDPLGLAPAPNPHTYVDNPVTWIDPFGLSATHNPVFTTRRGAFNAARDMAGVPRSSQPVRQWTIGGDPTQAGRANYVFTPYDPHGDPNLDPRAGWGHYYQYDTPHGVRVVAEHTSDPLAPYPHFHAGKPQEGAPRDVNMQAKTYKQIQPKHHLYYNEGGCGGK